MKKKIIPIIICIIIIAAIVVLIKIGKIGFVGTTFYTVSQGECTDPIASYSDGSTTRTPSKLNAKGECKNEGYFINNNKVNINIGNISCGNSIKIEEIKIEKGMKVYIKAKEKLGLVTKQCLCSTSLNIKFSKKVNSVTLVKEDGTELDSCI